MTQQNVRAQPLTTHGSPREKTANLGGVLILRIGDNPKLDYKALAVSPLGQRLKLLGVEKAEPWYQGYFPFGGGVPRDLF